MSRNLRTSHRIRARRSPLSLEPHSCTEGDIRPNAERRGGVRLPTSFRTTLVLIAVLKYAYRGVERGDSYARHNYGQNGDKT
jgi:hypothetical protein